MMLSLLCNFSGGKELYLSECDLTTACGYPKLGSIFLNASIYIIPERVNSAIVFFTLTSVRKYANLTPSGEDCKSIAFLNCPYPWCRCRGSPEYCDRFYFSNWSFFLLVIAAADSLVKFKLSNERPSEAKFSVPLQHKGDRRCVSYIGGCFVKCRCNLDRSYKGD